MSHDSNISMSENSTISLVEFLCQRTTTAIRVLQTTSQLLAGIRGICLGAEDPEAEHCLGTLPKFILSRHPELGTQSWFVTLEQLCHNKCLRDASRLITRLIQEWKYTNPKIPAPRRSRITVAADLGGQSHGKKLSDAWSESREPGVFYHDLAWGNKPLDYVTFQLMEEVFRRPHLYLPNASTFREVVALVQGILLCRRPPHGSVSGMADFCTEAQVFFESDFPLGFVDLADILESTPFHIACLIIANLIKQVRVDHCNLSSREIT
jgi:hypothetical protein